MKRLLPSVVAGLAIAIGPASAARTPVSPLLKRAAALTGLHVRRPVRVVGESATRFDADAIRILQRSYPPSLQQFDDQLYMRLGLMPTDKTIRASLASQVAHARAMYDPSARIVRVRRRPAAARAAMIGELARALVDQNFHLNRLVGLRQRNRDAGVAAQAVVDGLANFASGTTATFPDQGTPLERFLWREESIGNDGRHLLEQLRFHGGRAAMRAALTKFPQTTEQLLHVDKFLEREPAQNVVLVSAINDMRLTGSESFGELDVSALLDAFDVQTADNVAAGWGGGRIGLYATPDGTSSVALVLRWDTADDALEWRNAIPQYVAAAFPNATSRSCPAVDSCWLDGNWEFASTSVGTLSIFTSGANAELVAATLSQR